MTLLDGSGVVGVGVGRDLQKSESDSRKRLWLRLLRDALCSWIYNNDTLRHLAIITNKIYACITAIVGGDCAAA
jgi:hypothetical protein